MHSLRLTAADGTPFVSADAYLAHVIRTGEAGRLAAWLARGRELFDAASPAAECAPSAPRSMPPTSTSRARTPQPARMEERQ